MELKPGYKQTEVGVIPEDWDAKQLGTIAIYTNGKAHEKDIKDQGRYIVVNSKFISSEGETRKYSDDCFCPTSAGEVLMVMSDVPNGKAIAKCFYVDRDNCYTVNQRICALSPTRVDGKLLFYKLNRNPFYLAFDDGVKQTNLRKDDVLSCPLSIPKSVEEQRAMAAALGDVDAMISALDQLIAKKRDLKQAAMKQLLTGKQRLPEFDGQRGYKQTEVGVIPKDWEVKLLPEVMDITNGKAHEKFIVDHGRYIVVNSKFISSDGRVRKYTNSNFCPTERDSILMVMSDLPNGKALAKCFVVDANDRYAVNQRVCSFKPKKDHPRFLFNVLNRNAYFLQFDDGVQQTHLLNDVFRRCPVILPKIFEEQRAIATILSDMDAELTALERRRDKIRALKQGMMQELLTGKTRLV